MKMSAKDLLSALSASSARWLIWGLAGICVLAVLWIVFDAFWAKNRLRRRFGVTGGNKTPMERQKQSGEYVQETCRHCQGNFNSQAPRVHGKRLSNLQ
jgi:hypothetical protein